MTNSADALEKLLAMDFHSVLDVGSGGVHADILNDAGKEVTTINLYDADFVGDYLQTDCGKFDCIWASHVLEHQPNSSMFLKKCFQDLNNDGILAVTVPPLKSLIVGGHVSLWNAGVLLYQLVMAGFDCSQASVKTYGYNISVIVRKRPFNMPELQMDHGDLNKLAQFFPVQVKNDCFEITEVNW